MTYVPGEYGAALEDVPNTSERHIEVNTWDVNRKPEPMTFDYPRELAQALRNAQKAHHVYESALGKPDENWADWYAKYIFEEQRKW